MLAPKVCKGGGKAKWAYPLCHVQERKRARVERRRGTHQKGTRPTHELDRLNSGGGGGKKSRGISEKRGFSETFGGIFGDRNYLFKSMQGKIWT